MDLVSGGGDDLDAENPNKKRKGPSARSQRKSRRIKKRTVVMYTLPDVCPEAFPANTGTRQISCLLMDHQFVWLSLEDVDWAIKYLYAQHQLQGVHVLAPDDPGPQAKGDAAGDDLHNRGDGAEVEEVR